MGFICVGALVIPGGLGDSDESLVEVRDANNVDTIIASGAVRGARLPDGTTLLWPDVRAMSKPGIEFGYYTAGGNETQEARGVLTVVLGAGTYREQGTQWEVKISIARNGTSVYTENLVTTLQYRDDDAFSGITVDSVDGLLPCISEMVSMSSAPGLALWLLPVYQAGIDRGNKSISVTFYKGDDEFPGAEEGPILYSPEDLDALSINGAGALANWLASVRKPQTRSEFADSIRVATKRYHQRYGWIYLLASPSGNIARIESDTGTLGCAELRPVERPVFDMPVEGSQEIAPRSEGTSAFGLALAAAMGVCAGNALAKRG